MSKPVRNEPSRWLELLARAGYATKGVVYGLVGGLAVASVVAASGSVGGAENAVHTVGRAPFGQALLVLLGVGLFGYALWRFVAAYFDPENVDREKLGTLKRIGYVISGAIHVGLGVVAFQLASGAGGGGGGGGTTLLREAITLDTIGPALGVIGGLVTLGFAAYQIKKGVTADFTDKLRTHTMSRGARRAVITIARVGLIARGVVFAIIGMGVMRASIYQNPSEVQGVGGALRDLGTEPFGAVLLVVVAAGLAAYGAYQVAMSRYRRLPV